MLHRKFSIVTPSFNQARYIESTIRSVLDQGFSDLEYIIIDGGSTDGSEEIIKKYENRLSYWISEKDNGQSHAINKGFSRASGEIIGWLNSDDMLFPGALQRVDRVFSENPEVDVIYSNGVWIDEFDRVIRKRKNGDFHFKTWLYGMADPFQPEVFYRRRVLEKGGYLNEEFHMLMDREWWIRLAKSGCTFMYVNDEFAALRKHLQTKTSRQRVLNDLERWKLHDLYWEGFRFKNLSLHRIHWKLLSFYYLALRRLRIAVG